MAKKQFKAESKRLLDLMINSIYTHKEIFLREILSNASDAEDKLAYRALTDDSVKMKRGDFKIIITPDIISRTLTISDNGIGMSREELDENLGTICKSGSLQFKENMDEGAQADDIDVIGQFGVGFYSAFMVADEVTVITKAFGSDTAYKWHSTGLDGYTITPCEKAGAGTDVIVHLKADTEDEKYSDFLQEYHIRGLVKQYSDYIRYPIEMLMHKSRQKPRPEDAGEDYRTEWEDYTEWETLNSMVPLWQKKKDAVTDEEYAAFYQDKFNDYEAPLDTIRVSAEGTTSYEALLFIPAKAPYDFYTREHEKGMQLYSSGVLIMDKCGDLLPDYLRFVGGVVDTPDVSLNSSSEMLQQTRELKVIAKNLDKKVRGALEKLCSEQREKYETFWKAFGLQMKYGLVSNYGMDKEKLQDLVMFFSTNGDKATTLKEYRQRMKDEQEFIYYACGEDAAKIRKLPQTERILDAGYEILLLTEDVDEFCMQILAEYDGKKFKSINEEDALPETEEEKKAAEEKNEAGKEVLEFLKETLGERIKEARISRILKNHPVCMVADGPVSLEMEKHLKRQGTDMAGFKVERVLEINANTPAYEALKAAITADPEKAKKYAELLYCQALLIADLPLEDPSAYTDLVCSLMV